MGMRRQAREIALQVLYQQDVQPELPAAAAVARFYGAFSRPFASDAGEFDFELPDDAELRRHVDRIVRGIAEHRRAIDDHIGRASRNWRLERMGRVDRSLLRLAVYELLHCDEVPPKVVLNEAIEIAKRYGARETPAFVNGVLDRVLADRAP